MDISMDPALGAMLLLVVLIFGLLPHAFRTRRQP